MNLFLIGYRATGKSAVAEALSQRIAAPCIDADEEIARRAGKTIAEVFSQDGETAFRNLESQVVKDLAARDGCVVSLGGGAVLREENRHALRGRGRTVWLQASVETIQGRLLADRKTTANRPCLTPRGLAEEVEHVLAERTPIYSACADSTVTVDDKSPDAIADEILALLDLRSL
jgi:shikimate kinase